MGPASLWVPLQLLHAERSRCSPFAALDCSASGKQQIPNWTKQPWMCYELSQASSLLCRQTLPLRHLWDRMDSLSVGISRGRSIFRAWGFIIVSEKLINFLFCAGGLCTSPFCRDQSSDTWKDETCQLPADVTAWVERLVLAFTISKFAHISVLPELVFQKLFHQVVAILWGLSTWPTYTTLKIPVLRNPVLLYSAKSTLGFPLFFLYIPYEWFCWKNRRYLLQCLISGTCTVFYIECN